MKLEFYACARAHVSDYVIDLEHGFDGLMPKAFFRNRCQKLLFVRLNCRNVVSIITVKK